MTVTPCCSCCACLQTQLLQQQPKVEALGQRLAQLECSEDGAKAAAAAGEQLGRVTRELLDLQAEYNRWTASRAAWFVGASCQMLGLLYQSRQHWLPGPKKG